MDKLLFLIIGIIIGVIFTRLVRKKTQSSGYLRWDNSDPDSPYMFIEVKSEAVLNAIPQMKTITLDVKVQDFIPRN